jgi:hypothetical protein
MQTPKWHKNLANFNVGIYLEIEACEGELTLYAGSSNICVNMACFHFLISRTKIIIT